MDIINPPINKIKHADWPFILFHLAVYSLLMTAAAWGLDGTIETAAFFLLTSFLFLISVFHIYRLRKDEDGTSAA